MLPARQVDAGRSEGLLKILADWSSAVWAAAEDAGPRRPEAKHVAPGIALAGRPVFVCGAHRSGTKLIRDLLDGHPQLSVLPSEGAYLTGLQRRVKGLGSRDMMTFLGCEWLRRLANPSNQQPFWLLGRTGEKEAAYVSFARIFMGWWQIVRSHLQPKTSLWPHLTVGLSYAAALHGAEALHRLRWWVDKTPTNEAHVELLLADLPQARFVHVVRHPLAIYASRKRIERRAFGAFGTRLRTLQQMRHSFKIASRKYAQDGCSGYCVIRYEEAVARPEQTMDRLASFLGIDMQPSLLLPTVAGRPAYANSSFRETREPGSILRDTGTNTDDVSRAEIRLIAASCGPYARELGYEI